MVLWLWIGGALMGLGTIIALLPARKRVVLPREAPAETPELAEVPA